MARHFLMRQVQCSIVRRWQLLPTSSLLTTYVQPNSLPLVVLQPSITLLRLEQANRYDSKALVAILLNPKIAISILVTHPQSRQLHYV